MQKGKLIVLYGINNLWKTTQAHLLINRLREKGLQAEYLKYPIYDLAPSWLLLNAYLREGNPNHLSSSEFQLLQVINRTQYDSTLKNKLENWIWIIAEDYTGTGIARGTGAWWDQAFLEKINSHLHKEDLAFFFDGERFSSGIEKVHQHEQNNELMNKVRLVHQDLAQKLSREPINANLSIEEIQSQLQKIISEKYL